MSASHLLLCLAGGLILGYVFGRFCESRRWKRNLNTRIDPLFTAIRRKCEELQAVCRPSDLSADPLPAPEPHPLTSRLRLSS